MARHPASQVNDALGVVGEVAPTDALRRTGHDLHLPSTSSHRADGRHRRAGLAWVVTFNGNLGDTTNTALVAPDLGAARFGDDWDKANNVALYALNVAVDGTVDFTSSGWAAGGTDPYFTLFRGLDRATATVMASNYFHALAWGGDFTQTETLGAGDYTVAVGTFVNLSFAENLGSGVLADGFIGVGDPRYLGNGAYTLTVTLHDTQTVPNPLAPA